MIDLSNYELSLFGKNWPLKKWIYVGIITIGLGISSSIISDVISVRKIRNYTKIIQQENLKLKENCQKSEKLNSDLKQKIDIFAEECEDTRRCTENLVEYLKYFDEDMKKLDETLRRHPLYAPKELDKYR